MTSGRKLEVFCMQHGLGTENAYGGVAQAFGDSIPILAVPGGYPRPGWVSETQPNEQV
jgi:thiamine pyrophosphate-dependent acetolactate synthase large subunit-like protein